MKQLHNILGASIIGFSVFAQEPGTAVARQDLSTRADQAKPGKVEQPARENIGALNKISTVIGMPVKDSGGKQLGKVQDMVIELESGRIGYVVVALSANRMVPVPTSALKPAESGDHFVLNISPSVLAAAPSVTHDEWPSVDVFAVGGPAAAEKGQGKSSNEKVRRE